jgi:hypothetical protein
MANPGEERSERRANDHYVTPDWSIRRFLEKFEIGREAHLASRPLRILDPCAARGELIVTTRHFFPTALFGACDINPAFGDDLRALTEGATVVGDFLEKTTVLQALQFDIVLTNPPYALAEDFIRASLEVAPVVAMLLRINFLASRKRRNWLRELRPGVFVLPNRPSFTGEGGDMTEYAWMTFGHRPSAGQIDWLELTPAEEIRRSNLRAKRIHAPAQLEAHP